MSAIAGRNLLRLASRTSYRAATALPKFTAPRVSIAVPRVVRPFSTTMSPMSGAPVTPSNDPYDQEIVDIASYVHNYKIDSELAVGQKVEHETLADIETD